MLERCKSAQERWGGVHKLIDRWLEARKALIETYAKLRAEDEFTPIDTPKIQILCERLVDYTSTGHFEIYEQLTKEAEAFNDQNALLLAQKVLPEIQNTTTLVVEFNDKFGSKEHCNNQLTELPISLQALGLVLADRFELEDVLIQELHEAHSKQHA
ncbi:sigma D regulator [Marinomonas agarivorans]|nr:sigma D regulator [Marinomonas agarivorans]